MAVTGAWCSWGGCQRKKAFDSEGRGRGWLFERRDRRLLAWCNEFGRVTASKRGFFSSMKTGDGGTLVELKVEGEGVQICGSPGFASKPWNLNLELWMEAVIPDLTEIVLDEDLFLCTSGWSTATKPP